ncbi:MAG: single-stranded-DNA-specific exonuclease [Oleiphilaceae bacterium]|jgi:single-stranded-DNA-specific exonuclease
MKKTILRRDEHSTASPIATIPPFLSRIYHSRGVFNAEDLELSLANLLDSSQLRGIDVAVKLLVDAFQHKQKIMIVGDFDCDGATSTALAVHALRSMGAYDCQYLVPNRFEFGYGLTPEIVDLAATMQPDLIVTVDNGISSIDGVNRAKSLGIKVLVTDHHLPGDQTPDADAIVNPNQALCGFLSKNAAGVGVIFYVMSALRSALRELAWFEKNSIKEPNLGNYLDLVALGTVADLVPLDKNNRIFVEQGLKRIRAGRCRPGIRAILACAQRKPENIRASDMGFAIGPRLNAAGRLDDMSLGIECLLSEDEYSANQLALRLDQLNQDRKSIEADMKMDADIKLHEMDFGKGEMAWGLCLYEAHWHQGVIGILASRVKEKFHRPVIVFAPAADDPTIENPELKGSARSISGFHMRDALDIIAKRHPTYLSKFGGHAMAAGMTIEKKHLKEFTQAFDTVVREQLTVQDLESTLLSDGALSENELTIECVNMLELAGPWGQQFPEPRFDDTFELVQQRVLKDKHLKLVLTKPGSSQMFDAIQFNSEWVGKSLPEQIRVAYRPNINEFRGRKSVQLMIDHIETVS